MTDGTEVAASLELYDRDVELGILERADAGKLPSVVISMAADTASVSRALAAGAHGYLAKDAAAGKL